ncbi:hypothetical protein CHUAL_000253 [Chamberlinius hualienensis]
MKRRIGIIGYGHLGQYLVERITDDPNLELGFVWNRTLDVFGRSNLPKSLILEDLSQFKDRNCQIIVEVAHPSIVVDYGEAIIQHCDLMVGSPTAFADESFEKRLKLLASDRGVYIPSGALWGAEDIKKMADRGTLKALKVTMTKHPRSFKLEEPLESLNKEVLESPRVLFEGCVRKLCPLAPNNVNTMAAAAIAGHNLGFDVVQGCLISDPNLLGWHHIQVDVTGPGKDGHQFTVETIRKNPADPGAVTGTATYASFFSSLLGAYGKGGGFHLC